jgi:hypothetical protein
MRYSSEKRVAIARGDRCRLVQEALDLIPRGLDDLSKYTLRETRFPGKGHSVEQLL